jgi:hypothetical protein
MIKINGKSLSELIGGRYVSSSSKNVSIVNGKVIVDGQTIDLEDKVINVEITGNVDLLSADVCTKITVNGEVGTVKTMSGDVEVSGKVTGSVSTMSGDVRAGSIGGNASSMSGDIKVK